MTQDACQEVLQMVDRHSQRGVTSIEYALLAALISVAILGGLSATGVANGGIWGGWTAAFIAAVTP